MLQEVELWAVARSILFLQCPEAKNLLAQYFHTFIVVIKYCHGFSHLILRWVISFWKHNEAGHYSCLYSADYEKVLSPVCVCVSVCVSVMDCLSIIAGVNYFVTPLGVSLCQELWPGDLGLGHTHTLILPLRVKRSTHVLPRMVHWPPDEPLWWPGHGDCMSVSCNSLQTEAGIPCKN